MPCHCGAPIVMFDDNGEAACSDDPSHDIDGGYLDDDELADAGRWEITSDAEADWCLAKLARARWEIARIEERTEDEIDRIRTRATDLLRTPLRDEEFFAGHLTRYLQAKQATGEAGKTYRLLNGDLKSRAGSVVVEIEDEAAVLDFIEGHQLTDLLNIKVTPNKPAVKKVLQAGEEIPGARLVQNDDSFTISTPAGEPPAFLPRPNTEEAA